MLDKQLLGLRTFGRRTWITLPRRLSVRPRTGNFVPLPPQSGNEGAAEIGSHSTGTRLVGCLGSEAGLSRDCREGHLRATSRQARQLFDYLVRACDQCRWQVEPQRLGGLEVDHQLVLGRCLYWHVGGFLALQDAINITRCAPGRLNRVRAIRDQAPSQGVIAKGVDSRQSMPRNERDDE